MTTLERLFKPAELVRKSSEYLACSALARFGGTYVTITIPPFLQSLKVVFVCARILTPNGPFKKVLKPGYARSTKDGDQSLSDIFNDFASGEFEDSRIATDEKFK